MELIAISSFMANGWKLVCEDQVRADRRLTYLQIINKFTIL